MSFITLLVTLLLMTVWGTTLLFKPIADNSPFIYLIALGLTFSYAPKAAQKIIERKLGINGGRNNGQPNKG